MCYPDHTTTECRYTQIHTSTRNRGCHASSRRCVRLCASVCPGHVRDLRCLYLSSLRTSKMASVTAECERRNQKKIIARTHSLPL